MHSVARWSVVAVAMMSIWALPTAVSAGRDVWSGAPDSTIGEPTDTSPDPTTPDSSGPASTEPDGSAPETSVRDALVAAGDPDDDIDATTAAIAVVGFVALLTVASWWMVRRSDPDAEPMPRQHGEPGPPSDLI